MIDQLYQKAILKQAAAAKANGILENADLKLTVHNPLCGDRITVYINLDGSIITDFSHETKACVLCQASASILGECSIGETEQSLQIIHDDLRQNLEENGLENKIWPDDKWNSLNIFQPVSSHKNRFTCVTLPFESLLKALGGDDDTELR
jgi:nitrogen fixation NifU-like protein